LSLRDEHFAIHGFVLNQGKNLKKEMPKCRWCLSFVSVICYEKRREGCFAQTVRWLIPERRKPNVNEKLMTGT